MLPFRATEFQAAARLFAGMGFGGKAIFSETQVAEPDLGRSARILTAGPGTGLGDFFLRGRRLGFRRGRGHRGGQADALGLGLAMPLQDAIAGPGRASVGRRCRQETEVGRGLDRVRRGLRTGPCPWA